MGGRDVLRLSPDDFVIEMAITLRELEARAHAKITAGQLGELFYDLPTTTNHGVDREQSAP
jgi:hypothetical protein